MSERVAVVGAGNWGTALANLLAKNRHEVVIWSFEREVADVINQDHTNPVYLKGIPLHPQLRATTDLDEAVRGAAWVVSASPAQHVRRVMSDAAPFLSDGAIIVSASKGIEVKTLETMDAVLSEVTPKSLPSPVFLSGPSFALEVAQELPTAVTVASRTEACSARAQRLFRAPYFRVYTAHDVIGVELGGALKNVIAVAAGMAVGLGLGHNALAALITRGLAEMARLGGALGADPITFSGLAGMGDLILTCTGDLSRNRTVGVQLAQGRALSEILGSTNTVAEGVDTARSAHALALRQGIEMPIVSQVHAVLFEGVPVREAVETLMLREPKPEQWR
jgi:glycerol-3-phosphate dehydrogenase (NAD(P)+)